jgi:hypothetical protein
LIIVITFTIEGLIDLKLYIMEVTNAFVSIDSSSSPLIILGTLLNQILLLIAHCNFLVPIYGEGTPVPANIQKALYLLFFQ